MHGFASKSDFISLCECYIVCFNNMVAIPTYVLTHSLYSVIRYLTNRAVWGQLKMIFDMICVDDNDDENDECAE